MEPKFNKEDLVKYGGLVWAVVEIKGENYFLKPIFSDFYGGLVKVKALDRDGIGLGNNLNLVKLLYNDDKNATFYIDYIKI